MKNKNKVLLVIFMLLVISSGCSGKDTNNSTEIIYNPTVVELNNNTITKEDYIKYQDIVIDNTEDNSKNQSIEYSYSEEQLGLIKIENIDISQNYEVHGDDIVYNSIQYHNLYKAINEIDIPYNLDEVTFTNFILKVLKPQGLNIDVTYQTSKINPDEDGTAIPLSDIFIGMSDYEYFKSNYDSDITWSIQLYDREKATRINIYGCTEYMFIPRALDLTYDMNDFYLEEDYSITTESSEESTKQSEESEEPSSETSEN